MSPFSASSSPLVMGIVNLVADSFSGDGLESTDDAVARAAEMIADGAGIIDAGGESARTNRAAMSEDEEIGRLLAFVRLYRERQLPALLSINTWRPAVARAVLAVGGDLLNDIGGLPNAENARTCSETGASLVIMHTVGEPKTPHTHVEYPDVMDALGKFFEDRIALSVRAGLPRDRLVLDPGIDFAKQRRDNLRIYRDLGALRKFDLPILLPVSRKTVIGDVLGIREPAERDAGTIACVVAGMQRGASIFRVHNVRAAVQAVRMCWAADGAE